MRAFILLSTIIRMPCSPPLCSTSPAPTLTCRRKDTHQDTMPSGTAPGQVILTLLRESAEDRGGSDSDSSAAEGRAMTWALTSKAALGPPCQRGTRGRGLALFVLFWFFLKTGKHIVAKQ